MIARKTSLYAVYGPNCYTLAANSGSCANLTGGIQASLVVNTDWSVTRLARVTYADCLRSP